MNLLSFFLNTWGITIFYHREKFLLFYIVSLTRFLWKNSLPYSTKDQQRCKVSYKALFYCGIIIAQYKYVVVYRDTNLYLYEYLAWTLSINLLFDNIYNLFQHLLYRTLGLCLVVAETPEDQQLTVLSEVWKAVAKLKNPTVSILLSLLFK